MEQELKELLSKYEEELSDSKSFNPCYSCCDIASANETQHMLERFVNDLRNIME